MTPPRRLNHDLILDQYLDRLDLTVADIARLHGCGPNTIRRIARRHGLTNTVRSSLRHDHDAIATHYAAGQLSITEIARTQGCDPTTVHDIARSRGLYRTTTSSAGQT